jgi:hypothetical protein
VSILVNILLVLICQVIFYFSMDVLIHTPMELNG